MAKEKEQPLSTRQRQVREREEQAQKYGGVSSLALESRATDPKKDGQDFVVPGPGGQFVGEAEDDPRSPADLVVAQTGGIRAADEAGVDREADRLAKTTPEHVGDSDVHERGDGEDDK